MFTHDDIFRPLALAVIIDNKVRDPELQEFCEQAAALCTLFDLTQVTQREAMAWFQENEAKIEESLKSKGKNTVVLRALSRFSDDVHVENIYDAMVSISVSDQEYKREESDLIKSAATIWGFNRPPIKVVD